jgi:hypothetical protein
MSKVNFYLKGSPSEEKLLLLKKENPKEFKNEWNTRRPILISVAFRGKREIFSTGKFVALRFWNKDSKRIKTLLETPPSVVQDGEWLDAKKLEIEKYLLNAKMEYQNVTRDDLYELILSEVRPKNEMNSLQVVLKQFLAEHKTVNGSSIKKKTMKKYISLVGHIKAFQKNEDFTPIQYTTSWVKRFKEYLMFTVNLNDNTKGGKAIRPKRMY